MDNPLTPPCEPYLLPEELKEQLCCDFDDISESVEKSLRTITDGLERVIDSCLARADEMCCADIAQYQQNIHDALEQVAAAEGVAIQCLAAQLDTYINEAGIRLALLEMNCPEMCFPPILPHCDPGGGSGGMSVPPGDGLPPLVFDPPTKPPIVLDPSGESPTVNGDKEEEEKSDDGTDGSSDNDSGQPLDGGGSGGVSPADGLPPGASPSPGVGSATCPQCGCPVEIDFSPKIETGRIEVSPTPVEFKPTNPLTPLDDVAYLFQQKGEPWHKAAKAFLPDSQREVWDVGTWEELNELAFGGKTEDAPEREEK